MPSFVRVLSTIFVAALAIAPKNSTPKKASKKNAAAKTAAKKAAPKKMAPPHAHHPGAGGTSMPMRRKGAPAGAMSMPLPSQPATNGQMTMPMDHSRMGHGQMGQIPMQGMQHGGQGMMKAALGPYSEQRESSGTAWQPDGSGTMGGAMIMSGDWMLMAHGTANLVYDHQSGPRGDDKSFVSGMLMGMAQHPLGNGTLEFKAMLSPIR